MAVSKVVELHWNGNHGGMELVERGTISTINGQCNVVVVMML